MQEDLKKPLVQQGGFEVTNDDVSNIFVQEHINDGESLEILKKWDGYDGVEARLKTRRDYGISTDKSDLKAREKHFGNNHPIVKESATICELIMDQLGDKILQILILASVVSSVIGIATEGIKTGWLEGTAILVAVLVILTVTAANDYMKEKQFKKLYAKAETRYVNILRGGQMERILVFDLLVGDIMQIETGEILPVDGLLFKAQDMLADESSITGESDAVKKGIPKEFSKDVKIQPFLISGSKIMEGSGEMIVCTVGRNTRYGKLKETLQQTDDETPLQIKLDDLANDIGKIGMTMASLVFCSMLLHLIVEYIWLGKANQLWTMETVSEVVYYFIIAVTMIVVAVPEGLPLAVTLALAYSVGKMKDENNLVRFLQACETMGGADNVCSDKTGTLTTNKMTVVSLYAQSQVHTTFQASKFSKEFLDTFCVGACVNANALPKINSKGEFEEIGNKTECALLKLSYELGYNYQNYRPDTQNKLVKIVPFSSDRKKMSTIYQVDEKTLRVFCKGAPDYIIPKCVNYIGQDGNVSKIQSDEIKRLNDTMKKFSSESLRCLLLTSKDIPMQSVENLTPDEIENELTIVALAGIKDPLRPGIRESVAKCKRASVTVRMVTGDIPETAVAIAKDAGILDQDFIMEQNYCTVMKGVDFRNFVGGLVKKPDPEKSGETKVEVGNLQNFEIVAQNLKVMARSQPEDKYLLVVGLKQLGRVVAVTGDGTNDAPALKKADVGFAMGIAGTEVAKEASGIILLDDNFSSIITAIKYGRNIFDCIRKFLQFQLTINCVAIFMVFFGGLILRESPITPIQMLWVNLIMDTMASLALATEPPNDELLKRKPYGRTEYIITPVMWRNIIGHAIWQVSLLLVVLFLGPEIFDIESSIHQKPWNDKEVVVHYTLLFNMFVFLQIFNEINARKLKKNEVNVFKDFCDNPFFFIILVFTVVVQYIIIQYGGKAFRCTPLSVEQHLICMGIGVSSLVVGILIKLIPESCFSSIKLFRESPHIEPQQAEGIQAAYKKPVDTLKGSRSRRYSKRSSKNSKPSIDSNIPHKKIELEQQTNKRQ